jgi:photosystem II stability/assembly factor-like uncharacterized protein
MTIRRVFAGLSLIPIILASTPGAPSQWSPQESGTKARFRGLSVVSPLVVWASGTDGTFARTEDGGKTWKAAIVPGAAKLDFRDVHAVDGKTAYLLSAGPGDLSKIYKTTDAGRSWALQLTNPDSSGFLDTIAFWDADHGLAFGDPVEGRFAVFATDDGGKTWTRTPTAGMPRAIEGEGAFAASGTCLVVEGKSNVWFGTGGARTSRVFRSTDRGKTWAVSETPVKAGTPSAGIFSVAFRDADHGIAIGGDYKKPDEAGGSVALTSDGGKTWRAAKGKPPRGFRSAVAYIPYVEGPTLMAVGTSGADISSDEGENWKRRHDVGYHAVGFTGSGLEGWAVGDNGAIANFYTIGIRK